MAPEYGQTQEFVGRTWRALGVEVTVLAMESESFDEACHVLEEEIDLLDLACSRFRSDSEIAKIDAANGEVVHLSELLTTALDVALTAARQTRGDLDPSLGQAMSALGYDREFTLVRDGHGVAIKVLTPTWNLIDLDVVERTVRVPAGVKLDLGATAKALGSDRAARRLHDQFGGGFLVSLGGDIAVRGETPDGGWAIRVQDKPGSVEADPDGPSQNIALLSGGLATSSTSARRWRRGDREMHHLLDPRTCAPVLTPWRTVSVAAPTCVAANTVSTTTIIRGQAGLDYARQSGFAARLVANDDQVTVVNGWPQS